MKHKSPYTQQDHGRLFLAVLLAALVLFGWQSFVEWPRRQQLATQVAIDSARQQAEVQQQTAALPKAEVQEIAKTHEERIAASPRIAIASGTLDGTIALKGARFDNLLLAKYRETLQPDSPEVTLFTPNGDDDAYFAQVGWVANDSTIVPDQNTLWQADKKELTPESPVTLKWNNGAGVNFILTVTLDQHYMFRITQRVENHSAHAISVTPYGYINRAYGNTGAKKASPFLHEGPLGVMQGSLTEVPYKDLREKKTQLYENASGWFGLTDKYWLTSLVPDQTQFTAHFSYYAKDGLDRYQVDYLGQPQQIAPAASDEHGVRLFAGAKEIKLLDLYARGEETDSQGNKQPAIPLFDRSVDYGMFYLIANPLFGILYFFYQHVGNFGVAILLLTICVKLCLFPLANKSYKSMSQMRRLQPQMKEIRDKYFDDRIKLQQETMAIYKREKVNPASGCLPLIIQIPVFFALYRVLLVSIEMRHAPFIGWIHDLSATDPSNLFTLFGVIPWNAPIHLGILPMIYCATMVLQMSQQPTPPDPMQARMMKFMPYFLLFAFAGMPAGLLIYWIWSNMLTILQQQVITRQYNKTHASPKKSKAQA